MFVLCRETAMRTFSTRKSKKIFFMLLHKMLWQSFWKIWLSNYLNMCRDFQSSHYCQYFVLEQRVTTWHHISVTKANKANIHKPKKEKKKKKGKSQHKTTACVLRTLSSCLHQENLQKCTIMWDPKMLYVDYFAFMCHCCAAIFTMIHLKLAKKPDK